jgi:hypothetical protein
MLAINIRYSGIFFVGEASLYVMFGGFCGLSFSSNVGGLLGWSGISLIYIVTMFLYRIVHVLVTMFLVHVLVFVWSCCALHVCTLISFAVYYRVRSLTTFVSIRCTHIPLECSLAIVLSLSLRSCLVTNSCKHSLFLD